MPKSLSAALTDKIQNKEARVGIIGLGYVGMPLSLSFVKAGFKVIGFDIDNKKIDFEFSHLNFYKFIEVIY